MTECTPPAGTLESLHGEVLHWYAGHARDLPWRSAEVSPWGILVSEVMLQQTPVARVLPVWSSWVERWPAPADLAAAGPGEAVRAWGRLGYPRRALRLHEAAVVLVQRHAGQVPAAYDDLLALPGVGEYTAAAVASFAHGRRHVVLDTNVRRVLARLVGGTELPGPSLTRAERDRAASMLPLRPEVAATWAVAVMELGALVCTASAPRCEECPVLERCAWTAAGRPAYDGPARRVQGWAGTDRQCRGRLLEVLRSDPAPVPRHQLDAVWVASGQRERCLAQLVEDGLVAALPGQTYSLP